MKTTAYDITERELALISLMRNMRFGTLERVGIQDGQPSVIVSSSQRIDLTKESECAAVIDGIGHPIPLVPHRPDERKRMRRSDRLPDPPCET